MTKLIIGGQTHNVFQSTWPQACMQATSRSLSGHGSVTYDESVTMLVPTATAKEIMSFELFAPFPFFSSLSKLCLKKQKKLNITVSHYHSTVHVLHQVYVCVRV